MTRIKRVHESKQREGFNFPKVMETSHFLESRHYFMHVKKFISFATEL